MKFNERFNIEVGLKEAQRRFVNRAYNDLYLSFFLGLDDDDRYRINRAIASALGDRYEFHQSLDELVGEDFLRNLHAIEGLYGALDRFTFQDADQIVRELLSESEVDLGVEWQDGKFYRKGAKLLDEALVNDSLHWLRDKSYESVQKPFEKGLKHLLEAHVKKDLLLDVITDMYEAVEALAKIITERPNKDLSGNREMFISKVGASDAYKVLLKEYIDYANEFRHAEQEGEPKPVVTEREAESFVYLTGIFIRLAMPNTK